MSKVLINTEEAAALMSVNKNYLEHLRVAGNSPPYVRIGKYVRYTREDILEWVQKLQKYRSTSEYND